MSSMDKRLIIVLGMHRSGTSTITRGLNVLGVELGDRLMPSAEGNNTKGFFEDVDLNQLNIEMLSAVGSDWHNLAPIEDIDVEILNIKGYFLRAVELLRKKTANCSLFGLKDPRVAKLLPFWRKVFLYCNFDISYVLVVRNPLSVARSLKQRDNFSYEKSYMLWAGHVLASLTYTEGSKQVLVDYDSFMQSPQQNFEKIAKNLLLTINQELLESYQLEFLDEHLRHSTFELNDLLSDYACPPLVFELYAELIEASKDNIEINQVDFRKKIVVWNSEFNRIKSSLRWADDLSLQIRNLSNSLNVDEEITKIIKSALEQDTLLFKKSFDSVWYLNKYPDIAAAGIDPYLHYINVGVYEGRVPAENLIEFIGEALIHDVSALRLESSKEKSAADAAQKKLADYENATSRYAKELQFGYEQKIKEIETREQENLAKHDEARKQVESHLLVLTEHQKQFAEKIEASNILHELQAESQLQGILVKEKSFADEICNLRLVHEQELENYYRDKEDNEKYHRDQLSQSRTELELHLKNLIEREKEFSTELRKLTYFYEQKLVSQINESSDRERQHLDLLANMRLLLDKNLHEMINRERKFSEELTQCNENYKTEKNILTREFTQREHSYIQQLEEARSQIQTVFIKFAEHEEYYLEEISKINYENDQKINTQRLNYSERESQYFDQLSNARNQVETYLIELVEREKVFSKQLSKTHELHSQEKAQYLNETAQRLLELSGNVQEKQNELEQLKKCIDKLNIELNIIYSNFIWKYSAPIRKFTDKIFNQSRFSNKNIESKSTISQSENASKIFQISSEKNNGISDMSFSKMGTSVSSINELISFNDEPFIHMAYMTLLGRSPDAGGLDYYLSRLRTGTSKLDIISQLYLSKEGQSCKVSVSGLLGVVRLQRWMKIPIVGSMLKIFGSSRIKNDVNILENKLYLIDLSMKQRLANIEKHISNLQGMPESQNGSHVGVSLNEGTQYNLSHKIHLDYQHKEDFNANLYTPSNFYISNENGREYDLQAERERNAYYLNVIRESNLFDNDFYLSSYVIDPVFHHEPMLHYVLFGEAKGNQPYSGFWPVNYLKFNTDVADAGAIPFLHFIQIGKSEGRRSLPLPPIEGGLKATPLPSLRGREYPNPKKIAVCLHVYYDDLWDEFEQILARLEDSFDLFVDVIDRGFPLVELKEKIYHAYPQARVFVYPNHGRDIFPFVHMAAAGLFDPYDAVCKIHTKKSPHREDGNDWRNHLVNGVLPPQRCGELVKNFLANDELGILVADGQIFEGDQWWGSRNKNRVPELLHRVEIQVSMDRLCFPAGSIYWIKQPLVNLIRGMQLTAQDFEIEDSQLDGTTAHAFERILGYMADSAKLKVVETSDVLNRKFPLAKKSRADKPFVSCFYLPQFHAIPENDAWWGVGYTEWIGAAKAKPQFAGHYQPVTPVGTGFYDLRIPEVIGAQFKLAQEHGIDAFCIYYYWFDNGQRLLEAPVDNLLAREDINVNFYLCWANESWTRNWDGMSGEVLMSQTYLPGFEIDIAKDSAKYFADPRYYRLNGVEPRFVIYRPEDIPDLFGFVARLRDAWSELGFKRVNLGAVLFHLNSEVGGAIAALFDFFVEMPPHGLIGSLDWIYNKDATTHNVNFPVNSNYEGLIYSYEKLIANSINREFPDFVKNKVIRGVMPSWDNTARRGSNSHICFGANPTRFRYWVNELINVDAHPAEIMVNSWNEWGEKAMIEPGCQYGKGYLRALKNGIKFNSKSIK